MIIGTRRVEEARALDSYAGRHCVVTLAGSVDKSFEVFWDEPEKCSDPEECWCEHNGTPRPGWYWWSPSSDDVHGPFGSSAAAHSDAMGY